MQDRAGSSLDRIRGIALRPPRVTLTELVRSKKWRSDLAEHSIVELCDRNETTGYIVSPDAMDDLLATIESLEAEVAAIRA